MIRKFLLPALALATLAGCATGYGYRGGSGDYYYGQPSVDYRYYGGYGYGGSIGYGFGQGYSLDVFGRPVYAYPYGYYGGRYPGYPYGQGPRPHPPHGPGHGGHDGNHDGDHHGPPPAHGGDHAGNKPPWRDIGRWRERGDDQQPRPRRLGQADERPFAHRPPVPARPPAPVMRERGESRPAGVVRGGGSGERARTRGVRPSANE